MPQLEEDEWPNDDQPTTQEEQFKKNDESTPARQATSPEYPPELPEEALPTAD